MFPRLAVLLLSLCFAPLWGKSVQTRVEAAARFEQVEDVAYKLFFELVPGQSTFKVRSEITLVMRHDRAPLAIDFEGESVASVHVDGKALDTFSYDPAAGRIRIPAEALPKGQHKLVVEAVGKFSDDGVGLMRYVDETDQRTYLYTDFEPYEANRAFPCLDQPDLKATYELEVAAPGDWTVITNTPLLETRQEGELQLSRFKRSKRFSTYLFHLSAGPWASFRDPDFRYPLALYCRQSMARYLDPEELLEQTRRGFDYFEAYFDYPYPFEKYDQIFCPDYTSGAMENVGAITWNEMYIPKKPFSASRILDRRVTLWHEMAHQWFGDLVTMKWWDNLWLNESFATYMSYLAAEALGEQDTWKDAARARIDAISADSRNTTHPVHSEVPDTNTASAIFDSITYGKGFCVLRQLDRYLGGTNFRDGLRLYFRNNAWKNTTIKEFTAALEERYGSDLDGWMTSWIGTAGVNPVQVEIEQRDGLITRATLRQFPSNKSNVLRQHSLMVGLYYRQTDGKVALGKTIPVNLSGERVELSELIGQPAPELALPNIDQVGYLKERIDPSRLQWLETHFAELADLKVQNEVFSILKNMVIGGEWDPERMVTLIESQLPQIRDVQLLRLMSDTLELLLNQIAPNESVAKTIAGRVFERIRPLAEQEPGSELQGRRIALLEALAKLRGDTSFFVERLEGRLVFPGYQETNEDRWSHLNCLAELGYVIEDALLERVKAADDGQLLNVRLLTLATLKPDLENKRNAWQRIVAVAESNQDIRAMVAGFNSPCQSALLQEFVPRFFEELPLIFNKHGYGYAAGFCYGLWPSYGGQKTLELANKFLARKDLAPPVRKLVEGRVEMEERYLRARANWGSARSSQG